MTTPPKTIEIENLTFLAVPLEQAPFDEKGAIHVVIDLAPDGAFKVLDVSESAAAGIDPMNVPDRRAQWLRDSKTKDIWVGTYLEPAEKLFSSAKNPAEHRSQLVAKIRRQHVTLAR